MIKSAEIDPLTLDEQLTVLNHTTAQLKHRSNPINPVWQAYLRIQAGKVMSIVVLPTPDFSIFEDILLFHTDQLKSFGGAERRLSQVSDSLLQATFEGELRSFILAKLKLVGVPLMCECC